jgi:hypothetical protein
LSSDINVRVQIGTGTSRKTQFARKQSDVHCTLAPALLGPATMRKPLEQVCNQIRSNNVKNPS